MSTVQEIPAEAFRDLDVHEGDTFKVVEVREGTLLVEMRRDVSAETRKKATTPAAAWVEHAAGMVKLAPGETEDDVRMAYYREKYGLDS